MLAFAPVAEEDSYAAVVRSKALRTTRALNDRRRAVVRACVACVAEPMDHLMQRVTRESYQGGFLFSLLDSRTDPFADAQYAYGKVFFDPQEETICNYVFHFYGTEATTSSLLFEYALKLSADIQYYCEEDLNRYPYWFAKWVDPIAPAQIIQETIQAFIDMPPCCLCFSFSRKVPRQLFNQTIGVAQTSFMRQHSD